MHQLSCKCKVKSHMENENLISTHKQVTDYSRGHSCLLDSRYSQFVKTCFFLNFLFLAILGSYNSTNNFVEPSPFDYPLKMTQVS